MITGTLVGTITGLLGTAFTAWNSRKLKKLEIEDNKYKREHELKMIEANTTAMIKEVEANIKITETEIAGEIEKQDVDMFAQVQQLANKDVFKESYMDNLYESKFGKVIGTLLSFLFGCVDVLRAAMRPVITIVLIYYTMGYINGSAAIDSTTLDYLVGLTTTAVVWWFGHRSVTNNKLQIKK